jgi:hypothetical protein
MKCRCACFTNAGQVFDWTSNIGVDAVFVKGGNDGNLYSPEAKEDTGLHAPVNPQNRRFFGLSHISFCYDPNAVPTLTTEATTPVTLGDPISDTATLSGGNNPTGTITFTLYGPGDADCSGEPAFISENRPIVNGSATSAEFEPLAPGTYRWTAQYNGDDNNDPVLSPCNADNETSVLNKAPSAIATVQSFIPQDQATVTGFGTPGGTVTFELFKSLDCSGTAVYTEEVDLSDGTASTSNNGNPNATPAGYSINAGNLGTGEFSWKVTYSGDANNEGSTSCNEESTITEINNDNTPV